MISGILSARNNFSLSNSLHLPQLPPPHSIDIPTRIVQIAPLEHIWRRARYLYSYSCQVYSHEGRSNQLEIFYFSIVKVIDTLDPHVYMSLHPCWPNQLESINSLPKCLHRPAPPSIHPPEHIVRAASSSIVATRPKGERETTLHLN